MLTKIKEIKKNCITKVKEMKKNFKNSFAYALLFAPIMVDNAYADDDIKLKTLMPQVFKQVTDMAMWIGAFLLLWGLVQFGLALRNEDSDSKSRSIMVIVAAIVLMGIKAIFNAVIPEGMRIPEK
jgi:hypothetical protein